VNERDTAVLSAISALSQAHNLSLQYAHWDRLRVSNPSGTAVLDTAVIVRGEGIFWIESRKVPGLVFLFRPLRVLEALRRLDKGTQNGQK
jgi:hypothetical protein